MILTGAVLTSCSFMTSAMVSSKAQFGACLSLAGKFCLVPIIPDVPEKVERPIFNTLQMKNVTYFDCM